MTSPRNPSQPLLATGSVASEVSHLFRTKRVSEIRAYEQQIRQEAHEKSDSLRDLLGTRYKDLLKAADEMSIIHEASVKKVRDALRNMAKEAAQMRDVFQRQASEHTPDASKDLDRRRDVHQICEKLKHIVDSPEVLYACLEEGQIYDAAVRYGLAGRNYKEVKETSGLEGVANRFAERRWKQVSVFRQQILSAAEKRLVTPGLSSEVYAKVMASLILLTSDRDIVSILDGFFAARTTWLDDESEKADGAQKSICAISKILRETISCLADMFWRSSVEKLLKDVDDEAAKQVSKLASDGSLSGACHSWLRGVRSWLDDRCPKILENVASSRALADILRSVDEVFEVDHWKEDCTAVLQQEPGFAFELFKPFISDRAGIVASDCIGRAVDKALSDIEGVWTDLEVDSHAGKLMWSIVSNQSVGFKNEPSEKLGYQEGTRRDDNDVGDMLASSGQVSTVVGLFESSLNEALTDVTALTQRIPSVSSPFDQAVKTCLPRILDLLKNHLDSIPSVINDEAVSKEESCEYQMESALFVARAATALGNAKCVRSAYCFSNHGNAALTEFKHTAYHLSCDGYRTWANRLCIRLRRQLLVDLTSERVLDICTGWSNGGNEHLGSSKASVGAESALRYPTTASTALVNFMLRACTAANRSGGFALPPQAIQYLRDEMIEATADVYKQALSVYEGASDAESSFPGEKHVSLREERSDNAAMQMLFDIQTLQQFLGCSPNSSKSGEKKDLKFLEGTIQASVDPIDLASCRKAMCDAVSSYASRTGVLFGTVTRGSSNRPAYTKRPISTTGLSATANLVSLSRPVPRFTYLPAPMPSSYSVGSGGTAGLNAKAAIGMLRNEATAANGASYRKRESDISVAGYASKVSESVTRLGRGFFESLTRTTE